MKYLENMRKPVKVEHGCCPSHLRASYVVTTYIYAHHVSYVRAPYASNVGDVPEYVCPIHICEAMRWLSHT